MSFKAFLKKISPQDTQDEEVPVVPDTSAGCAPLQVTEAYGFMAFGTGALSAVTVNLRSGAQEVVQVDGKRGPQVLLHRGDTTFVSCSANPWHAQRQASASDYGKTWDQMSSTEKTVVLDIVAHRNAKVREQLAARRADTETQRRQKLLSADPWEHAATPAGYLSWSAEKRMDL
eukprot:CAMPEP_0179079664 /NCGR_PEP_ID=MMETSP0796-20121207/35758_1 /TAXON_ID=73915 /ORGANISM="Pyrodinium bahamense, Strain pbaha01" /LENGTH=173 /DNA_ID=CAMNT_0020777005 /DNA_START=17 /DNA_END=535 /DNA_ORIENTATION=-